MENLGKIVSRTFLSRVVSMLRLFCAEMLLFSTRSTIEVHHIWFGGFLNSEASDFSQNLIFREKIKLLPDENSNGPGRRR